MIPTEQQIKKLGREIRYIFAIFLFVLGLLLLRQGSREKQDEQKKQDEAVPTCTMAHFQRGGVICRTPQISPGEKK